MIRVLITGMSGTGKSTVIQELAARGYKAIDLDSDAWSEWTIDPGDGPGGRAGEPDWTWREDRIRQLLATEDADILFISGCSSNQGRFYPQLDHVILLTAPAEVLVARLASRTSNPYGKDPAERARVLYHLETVEPVLRRTATAVVDTSASVADVVRQVMDIVQGGRERYVSGLAGVR
jgi:dephospho-CoA kinase